MANRFLIASLIAVALLVLVGVFLSQDYTVTRSIVIDAAPSAIHEYVGDLKRWPEWGPWQEVDPSMEVNLGKKTTGVGAERNWTSDRGAGKVVFTESAKETGIVYDMTFGEGKSKSSIRYEREEQSTRVTWQVDGVADMPVFGGYAALLMDEAIGEQFEKGLEKLKQVVEG
ncbi:MAG: SRPBCC family protein [Planctomycetota bacterium]